jgi:hypothetical protein
MGLVAGPISVLTATLGMKFYPLIINLLGWNQFVDSHEKVLPN